MMFHDTLVRLKIGGDDIDHNEGNESREIEKGTQWALDMQKLWWLTISRGRKKEHRETD